MGRLTAPLPKKYKYRKEQILNILACSGEIPTDLYIYLNISRINFKKICSNYAKENIIKPIIRDNIHGYVLTIEGKQYLRKISRIKLNFNDIQTQTINIQQRRRNHQLARLYAILDILDIPYEPSKKPAREQFDPNGEKIVFYTAQEYKKEKEARGKGIQGSRFKGLLIGKGKILPVYLLNQHLINFHRTELSLINEIGKDYFRGRPVENAVMFCSDSESTANIFFELNNYQEGKGSVDITSSSYYSDVFVLPLDKNLALSFQSIYKNDEIKEYVRRKYHIEPPVRKNVYDGQVNGKDILIAANLEVIHISRYLFSRAYVKETARIYCHEYIKPILETFIERSNEENVRYNTSLTAKIHTIKAEEVITEHGELRL